MVPDVIPCSYKGGFTTRAHAKWLASFLSTPHAMRELSWWAPLIAVHITKSANTELWSILEPNAVKTLGLTGTT